MFAGLCGRRWVRAHARHAFRHRRFFRRPLVSEPLEHRLVLATAIVEVEPNNSLANPQPLADDTAFEVSGAISTLRDVDFYSFQVIQGFTIHLNVRALNPNAPEENQFDPVIGLFDPSGELVQTDEEGDTGVGSYWADALQFAATATGIWTVGISDYDDDNFDGIGGDRDGYGTDTGGYILDINAARVNLDNDFSDLETVVLDNSLPTTHQTSDLDGDDDFDLLIVRGLEFVVVSNLDDDPQDQEVVVRDPTLTTAFQAFNLDDDPSEDNDFDLVIVRGDALLPLTNADDDPSELELFIHDPVALLTSQMFNLDLGPGETDVDVIVVREDAPISATLRVQDGQNQRSVINRVDLSLDGQVPDLQMLIDQGLVELARFELDGTGPGELYDLAGVLSASDRSLSFEFGPAGIGGTRNTAAGDGLYRIRLDLDGDGSLDPVGEFFRIFGDADGDAGRGLGDLSLILEAIGTNNPEADINNDGIVERLRPHARDPRWVGDNRHRPGPRAE